MKNFLVIAAIMLLSWLIFLGSMRLDSIHPNYPLGTSNADINQIHALYFKYDTQTRALIDHLRPTINGRIPGQINNNEYSETKVAFDLLDKARKDVDLTSILDLETNPKSQFIYADVEAVLRHAISHFMVAVENDISISEDKMFKGLQSDLRKTEGEINALLRHIQKTTVALIHP